MTQKVTHFGIPGDITWHLQCDLWVSVIGPSTTHGTHMIAGLYMTHGKYHVMWLEGCPQTGPKSNLLLF